MAPFAAIVAAFQRRAWASMEGKVGQEAQYPNTLPTDPLVSPPTAQGSQSFSFPRDPGCKSLSTQTAEHAPFPINKFMAVPAQTESMPPATQLLLATRAPRHATDMLHTVIATRHSLG